MDIPATQICDDYDFTPTQKLSHSTQNDASRDGVIQVGTLNIGSNTYPIKKGITTIGRLPECSIVLTDQTVSKKHAEIEASSRETAWICDLNSSNKTRLNNTILRPGRCYELKDGNELNFGTVHAIYNVYPPMDDSVVPETPAPNRQKNMIIPGTPDSSLNNSSISVGNDSIIPSTQADVEGAVFRRPSAPQRNSSSTIKKTVIRDSFSDDSTIYQDVSSDTPQEQRNGEQRVSIHDVETQKAFESHNETDIHDVETQKVCLNDIATIEKHVRKKPIDIHDMETQHDENIETQNAVDIHDMETQLNIDIHDIKAPNKIGHHDASARNADINIRDVDKCKTEEIGLADESKSNNDKEDIKDNETKEGKYSSNNADTRDDKCETFQTVVHIKEEPTTSDEHTKDDQKSSQECLQLSLSTNFEDDCSELDRSRALVGSQNLLEDLLGDDDPLNMSKLKSSTSEITDKSTDEENIFDAATQVKNEDENIFEAATQRINYQPKASQVEDDSDESNQDCLFQRYSRIASQDSQTPSKSQSVDSEDSDTDEEGHFAEIAVKEKRASASFEVRLNGSKEATSGDSEDMFDVPTQRINRKSTNSSTTVVDFDAPTQVIQTKKSEDVARMKEVDNDDMAATQILPMTKSSPKVNEPSIDLASSETEVDYNAPTQIVNISEKVSEFDNNKVPVSSDVVEDNTEDTDYEMAPTQLISEVDENESASTTDVKKVADKSSLNDSLEKNLKKMFSDVINDDDIEEHQLVSTQVLTNMLQSSQGEDKPTISHSPNENNTSPIISKTKRLPRSRKSKIDIASISPSKRQHRTTNLTDTVTDDESQNTDNYFTNLTSTRKKNVIGSQDVDSPVADTSDDKKKSNNEKDNVRGSPSMSSTLGTSEEPERTDVPKSNEEVSEKSSKTDNQVSRLASLLLEENDDDILAAFPEVRISGTLSNPASPTLSESGQNTGRMHSKRRGKKAEPKKKSVPRKSTRKTPRRENNKDTEPSVSRLNSPPILEKFNNFDVDKASINVDESDDEKVIETFKQSVTNTAAKKRKSKSGSELQQKSNSSIDSQEEARHSPSIQGNRKTRNSSKENVDRSSVFQVEKEALGGSVVTKPAKNTTLSSSRGRKRSLSSEDAIDTNKTKKRRESVDEGLSETIRDRRTRTRKTAVNKKNSETILDYMTTRNSPVSIETSRNTQLSFTQESIKSKQLMVKVMRFSPSSPIEHVSPRSQTKCTIEDIVSNETKPTRRTSVADRAASNKAAAIETEKAASNIRTRGKKNRKATNTKRQLEVEVINSQSEESQEVEMIMSASLIEQSTTSDSEKKKEVQKETKNVSTRNTRKRANKSTNVDVDSASISNLDTVQSEMTTLSEPVTKKKRGTRQSTRAQNVDHNSSFSTSSPFKTKHKILFTGVTNDFSKLLTKLGASQVEDPSKCSVLVTDKVRRTFKFLCALGQSVPIVSIDWLLESERVGHFLDVKNYILKDPAAEAKFGFKLRGSLEKAKDQKLLEGYTVVLTPNVAPPPLPELKSIITSCGGKPLVRPPSTWPQKAVVISQESDLTNATKFIAKAPKTVTVQSTEFLLTGILRQELDFNKYKLT
ncbi:mediator of DNA damage checkpoint protein 1 [Hylaeus volcanicus]|uniref:mediator of DNA damage checkpoint protein 1 n=1 Tax=Hylaeus volcanicus TaxID=313075 RepID=UPI0023B7809E|nr:mediator of DNA damage checkpoint protein 1 [Hylaeus volcanicus]